MSWSEARLHAWLSERPRPSGLAGSRGHDAAVLEELPGRPVWCTDQVHVGRHLERDDPPLALGRKAVGRTLSDLAACGATPVGVLLALALPRGWTDGMAIEALSGAEARAAEAGAALLGGDLSGTDGPASACVSALGWIPAELRPPGRDRARPGDVILLTGPVGGSRLGRHREPAARLVAGRQLLAAGVAAMMDVSDGLALDASRLAQRSGVAIELDATRIPIHPDAERAANSGQRSPLEHALGDGEDHELLACLPAERAAALLETGLVDCPGARVIGQVLQGEGLSLRGAHGEALELPPVLGWLHGG